MTKEFPKYQPEDLKKALINQGKMLEEGASLTEDGVLIATEEQIERAKKEMLAERPDLAVPKPTKESVELKPKEPELLIWIPENYSEQLGESNIVVLNKILTENKFPQIYSNAIPAIEQAFVSATGNKLPGAVRNFLIAYASNGYGYNNFMDRFKKEVGPRVYSKRQLLALGKLLDKFEFHHDMYTEIVQLYSQAKNMPDLPLESDAAKEKKIEKPAEPEPQKPSSSTVGNGIVQEAPKNILSEEPKTDRQREMSLLEFEVKMSRGYGKSDIKWPKDIEESNKLACMFFEGFVSRGYDAYQEALKNEIPTMQRKFESLGIAQGFADVREFVNAYWEKYKSNIIKANNELLAKNLESDPEYQKLPQQVKQLIALFNNQVYPNKKFTPSEVSGLLNQIGARPFSLQNTEKALSTLIYEFGLKVQNVVGDADSFGIEVGDRVYLIPNRGASLIGPNRIAHLKALNISHEMGKGGNFRIEPGEQGRSTPVKVLKPVQLRRTKVDAFGPVYKIDQRGEIIITPE
ncbi:MAG: hypothetical protein HY918_04715 [Candidatus Doudnabacteria bacterium]|nr:hypothetical protein [Candidatus Doudnabacteria bacterium]